jgi:hypothetical protein
MQPSGKPLSPRAPAGASPRSQTGWRRRELRQHINQMAASVTGDAVTYHVTRGSTASSAAAPSTVPVPARGGDMSRSPGPRRAVVAVSPSRRSDAPRDVSIPVGEEYPWRAVLAAARLPRASAGGAALDDAQHRVFHTARGADVFTAGRYESPRSVPSGVDVNSTLDGGSTARLLQQADPEVEEAMVEVSRPPAVVCPRRFLRVSVFTVVIVCGAAVQYYRPSAFRVLFSLPSCPLLSCPLLSCPLLSCPLLSCPLLSCPLLSCPALSCTVLQCAFCSSFDGTSLYLSLSLFPAGWACRCKCTPLCAALPPRFRRCYSCCTWQLLEFESTHLNRPPSRLRMYKKPDTPVATYPGVIVSYEYSST